VGTINFNSSQFYFINTVQGVESGQFARITANCNPGDIAWDHAMNSAGIQFVTGESYNFNPGGQSPNGWDWDIQNDGPDRGFGVFVVCYDNP
jgi:hypothetical protein